MYWSNPVGLDVAVDEDWVSIERGPGRSPTGPGAGLVVESRWPAPGGHHLGDGGDEKELTDDRLEDGERLTGVGLRHQVAVARSRQRYEAEEQVLARASGPCAPKKGGVTWIALVARNAKVNIIPISR